MAKIVLLILSLICFVAPALAGDIPAAAPPKTILTPELTTPKEQPRVLIYTLSTCPHCKEAKRFMRENHIPFSEKEVGDNSANMAELLKIFDEMGVPKMERGVPLIIVDGSVKIQGFDKKKLLKALENPPKS